MLLDLTQLRGGREHFQRTYEASAFESADDDYRIVQPVALVFDVVKKNRQFTLAGRVSTLLELQCGRCLEPFRMPVDASFDLLYLPHAENAGEGEVEIEDDDLSTAFYSGEVIDLGQLMREQFCLALPMKPLCSDGCHGLCPYCGANLNQVTCTCAPSWVDPRLEALRPLLGSEKDKI